MMIGGTQEVEKATLTVYSTAPSPNCKFMSSFQYRKKSAGVAKTEIDHRFRWFANRDFLEGACKLCIDALLYESERKVLPRCTLRSRCCSKCTIRAFRTTVRRRRNAAATPLQRRQVKHERPPDLRPSPRLSSFLAYRASPTTEHLILGVVPLPEFRQFDLPLFEISSLF